MVNSVSFFFFYLLARQGRRGGRSVMARTADTAMTDPDLTSYLRDTTSNRDNLTTCGFINIIVRNHLTIDAESCRRIWPTCEVHQATSVRQL